jgi:hypothetical protein
MRNRKLTTSASRHGFAAQMTFAALALAACAAPAPVTEEPDAAAEPARLTPRMVIAPELALQGVAAVELWSSATLDAFAPQLTIGSCGSADEDLCLQIVDEPPIGCGAQVRGAVACYRGPTVDVWRGVPDEWRVSVVAHELGHSLGLGHGPAGLMSPDRDRTHPCIEHDDLTALDDATGIAGTTACVR